MGHFINIIKNHISIAHTLHLQSPTPSFIIADMMKVKSTRQLSKVKPWLRKASRLLNGRRPSSRIVASPNFRYPYEYKTYSCLHVPNTTDMAEVEILHLTVRHEIDRPCRWIRGQIVEIDRERDDASF